MSYTIRYQMVTALSLLSLVSSACMAAVPVAHDSTQIVHTIQKFHAALSAGDSSAAVALLAPEMLVMESGDTETRSHYIEHHLPADIEFSRAVTSVRTVLRVTETRNAAWVASTSVTTGTFKGREINSTGAELIVLRRVKGKWLIDAIHWSSARKVAQPK